MPSLVTLAEAKAHLRIEHNLDDALIMGLCEAYSDQCEHILERKVLGEGGLVETVEGVPWGIKLWILAHVNTSYENRESAGTQELKTYAHLGGLLDPFRHWEPLDDSTDRW